MARTLILVLCSVLLLQSCVQGMSPLGRRRCLCMGRGANSVDIKQIKKFEVFPPSAKCEKMEIIAKLKTGEEKCLNHSSKQVKSILQMAKKRLVTNRAWCERRQMICHSEPESCITFSWEHQC